VLDRHALDAAGEVDRPGHRSALLPPIRSITASLGRGEVLVPAELLEDAVGELGIAVLDLGVLGVIAVAEQADLAGRTVRQLLLALQTKARAERAAAFLDRKVGVVEQRRARVLEFRRAPAWPRQTVIVAFVRTGGRLLRAHVEIALVRHVRLQALGRLSAVARRPAATIDLAQQVFRYRNVVLDLDVLEHLLGVAELFGEEVHHLVVVFRLEDRLDDLFAPLDRPVRGRARAVVS
jgi:hypothetical protein